MVSQNCLVWNKILHDIKSVAVCGNSVKVQKLTKEIRFSYSIMKKTDRIKTDHS